MSTASTTFVNYYEILGLPRTAQTGDIEKKIKEELRTWCKRQGSPDLSKRQEAELRMQHLAAARDALLDTDKRASYDQRLATQQATAPRQTAQPGGRNWVRLAEEYLSQNDYHSAAYASREATQIEGNSARAWNLRARSNAGLGQLSDAAYEARQAAELEPVSAQYQFDLGSIYEQLQRWDDALSSYESAARLEPQAFLYQLSIAGVYLQNDLPNRALPMLEEVYRAHPDEEMVNYYLASALGDAAEQIPSSRTSTGYMITSDREIAQMAPLVQRAMGLKHNDRDLRENLLKIVEYIDSCKRVKFSLPPSFAGFGLGGLFFVFLFPVFLVLGSFGVMGSSLGAGSFMLLIGGLSIFGLVKLCWVPVWKSNKRSR